MKILFPSFAPPERWRNSAQSKKLEGDEWKALRQRILARDNFTCAYCGYRSDKYQIVDHIDLYQEAKYSQSDIVRITREMRDKGSADTEIIAFLGLKNKAPFKMDREYLKKLLGFVTSRKSPTDMYSNWVRYHKMTLGNIKHGWN